MKIFRPLFASSILLMASTSFATEPTVLVDDYSGHRIGGGFSSTKLVDGGYGMDWGKGLKVEYGYDFNQIVGVNVSYAKNKDDASSGGESFELDGSMFQVDADIGYAFRLDGFDIKPYGVIGLARANEELTFNGPNDSYSISFKDTSVVMGFGGRLNLEFGLYADLRFDLMNIDGIDTDQTSFTIGYTF